MPNLTPQSDLPISSAIKDIKDLNKDSKFDDHIIKENLSSNLCRCCGYQCYVDACKSLSNKKKIDDFSRNKKDTIKLLKKIQKESIALYIDGKRYFAPRYINELKKIIDSKIGQPQKETQAKK